MLTHPPASSPLSGGHVTEDAEHTTSGSRQSCDPYSGIEPAASNTPPASQAAPTAPPAPNSLDTQESTVRRDFDRWMHEKHSVEELHHEIGIDESSESARFRHAGWAVFRRRIWESMLRTGQSAARRRGFGECGSYSWIEQSTCEAMKFRVRHNHCHDRLCTPCANAKSARVREALMQAIAGQPVSFITLTLCGKAEPLTDLVDRLYKHFRALRLHPLWEEKVRGGAAFLEIKWSDKARRWHPHLHIVADASFIDQGILSTIWRTITKDSYIVDIRRVGAAGQTASYVTKYASKPLNTSFMNSPVLLDEALKALKGRRLCLCFGTWYGTALTEAEEDGLDEVSDGGDWKMFCDMESLLARARGGERDAITVLRLAGIEEIWRRSLESG